MRVLGAAGHLLARLQAGQRAADLVAGGCWAGIVAISAALRLSAWRRARPTHRIDARRLGVVGRRAPHIGQNVGLIGGDLDRASSQLDVIEPNWLINSLFCRDQAHRLGGRRARHDTHGCHAVTLGGEWRPQRRAPANRRPSRPLTLKYHRAAGALRRNVDLRDQFIFGERGFVIAGEQILNCPCWALAGTPSNRNRSAERNEHRRQVHMWVGVRQCAANGSHIAHADIPKPAASYERPPARGARHLANARSPTVASLRRSSARRPAALQYG